MFCSTVPAVFNECSRSCTEPQPGAHRFTSSNRDKYINNKSQCSSAFFWNLKDAKMDQPGSPTSEGRCWRHDCNLSECPPPNSALPATLRSRVTVSSVTATMLEGAYMYVFIVSGRHQFYSFCISLSVRTEQYKQYCSNHFNL